MMTSATMSHNALKRENASASANVLMCKQWWKVCWMYGDQEKYYRQLYGKHTTKKYQTTTAKTHHQIIKHQQQQVIPDSRLYENTLINQIVATKSTPNTTPTITTTFHLDQSNHTINNNIELSSSPHQLCENNSLDLTKEIIVDE